MTEKELTTLITAIKANTNLFNKFMSLLPLNKRLVDVIVTSVESELLCQLLYIENFYLHVDQDMVDRNYKKFVSAINEHLYSLGCDGQINNDNYTDNHFYNNIIQNSLSLTGTDLIFSDNRTEDDFPDIITVIANSSPKNSPPKKIIDDDLPF